ncbi:MAG: plastocyanin/azurin family copper-binding protein [Actinomycetota bacterium]|nr:plastocyanin/azurin family copper-binding protein [Actinomycetota bacterium]
MKTKKHVLAPLAALALLLGACGGGSDAPAASSDTGSSGSTVTDDSMASESASGSEVTIQNFAFAPKKLEVAPGTTVVWTNEDDILHTVTSGIGQKQGIPGVTKDKEAKPDGTFDQEVEFEDTFEFTFDKAGTYDYFCAIHPGMTGVVTVK